MKIDVIIPVYKPDKIFLQLLDSLSEQTLPINRIIVMNVEQKYYDRFMYSSRLSDKHENMEVRHIAKREFDPGKTRNQAVKLSDAEYFLMMDANTVPVGNDFVAKLFEGIASEGDVAVSYGRVLLTEDAPEYEKYVTRYYFPEDSSTRSLKDVESMGRTAYMSSNLCALYRRDIFDSLGGFLNHVITNEDVLYAARAINEGYKIKYIADACVINTREISEKEHAKISFDYAVSMVKHPETFDISQVRSELKKIDKMTLGHLKRHGFKMEIWKYKRISRSMKKGFSKGVKYKKLAAMELPRLSASPEYWRMDDILRARSAVDVHSGYGRSDAEKEMLSTPPVKAKENNIGE